MKTQNATEPAVFSCLPVFDRPILLGRNAYLVLIKERFVPSLEQQQLEPGSISSFQDQPYLGKHAALKPMFSLRKVI